MIYLFILVDFSCVSVAKKATGSNLFDSIMQCVILRKVPIPNEEAIMKTFVETSSILLEGVDEMIREGYFHDRTEAVNEALTEMLDRYKLSKLRAKERKIGQNIKPRRGN